LFREGGGLDPLRGEVELNKTIQYICSEGVGDLIPFEKKWKLINHSTYLFGGVGGFDPF